YKYLTRELALCSYSAMLISRSCFESVPFPSAAFPSWQDDDMALTVGKAFPVLHCGHIVTRVHLSTSSISGEPSRLAKGCSMIVRKYWRDILANHGPFRLFLWELRIVRLYLLASAKKVYNRLSRAMKLAAIKFLDRALRPFFYRILA